MAFIMLRYIFSIPTLIIDLSLMEVEFCQMLFYASRWSCDCFFVVVVNSVPTLFHYLWQTSKGSRSSCVWGAWDIISQGFPTKFLRLALPSVTWAAFNSLVMERAESLFFISPLENLWPFFPWSPGTSIYLEACYFFEKSVWHIPRVTFLGNWFCFSKTVLFKKIFIGV